jgi:hypothetical protein
MSASSIRSKVLKQMAGSVFAVSVPVAAWWKWAADDRTRIAEDVRTRIRVPGILTTDDMLLEKVKPGDVLLFDRRCEKCDAGPWAALGCITGRHFLCNDSKYSARTVDSGKFDHMGEY